uniref:Uncharacterized protein n=1 Tax=Anguilla anguilla TaxID=7936 RepID=A0A0E9UG17_ANGAN
MNLGGKPGMQLSWQQEFPALFSEEEEHGVLHPGCSAGSA